MSLAAQPMAGTYTINKNAASSSSNYISFQSFFNALVANGVNGNVNANVVSNSGPYVEQVDINAISGVSSVAQITVNGNNEVLRFAAFQNNSKHTLRFNGASRVTIKNLTIEAAGSSQAWGVHFTNGASYNQLDNCNIRITNFNGSWNGIGIVISASNTNALSTGNAAKNLLITSCTVSGEASAGPGQGIVVNPQGNSSSLANITIRHCKVEDFFSNGIFVTNSRGVVINNNQISRPKRISSDHIYGIRLVNLNREDTVSANRIFSCYAAASVSSLHKDFYGIYIENNAVGDIVVANNLVFNNPNFGKWHGVYLACSKNTFIEHNTIVSNGNTMAANNIYGFLHNNSTCNNSAGSRFRNNIISITRNSSANKTGIYQNSGAITINHNNLFLTGSNAHIGWAGGYYSTLTNWQAATGLGAPFGTNSTQVDPNFVDLGNGNLSPQAIGMDNSGTATGITNDIANILRDTANPDVGAYEFEVNANVSRIEVSNAAVCEGDRDTVKVWIVNNATQSISNFSIGLKQDSLQELFQPVLNTIAPNDSLLVTFTTLLTYSKTGSSRLQARIKGKPFIASTSVLVNPKPIGSKILTTSKIVGIFNGGDAIDPDIIASGDSSKYEVSAPTGFTNSNYNTAWIIDGVEVQMLSGSATLNPTDTLTIAANSQNNAVFVFRPSPNLIGETVKLTITIKNTATQCTSKNIERYIKVVEKPNALFTASNVCEGDFVSFQNQSSGNSQLSYKWYFGDGDSSLLIHPQKRYNAPGNYVVQLFTTTTDGFTDSASKVVTVYNAPDAGFVFRNQCEGTAIDFQDTTKVFNGSPNYSWNFGDNFGGAVIAAPSYLYSNFGVYDVVLTVTDSLGCLGRVSKKVTFAQKPTAGFSFPPLSCNQKKVVFTNNTPNSAGLGFTWLFGDGDSTVVKHAEHTYTQEGTYTVKLLARNGFNCVDTAKKDIVLLGSPEPDFTPSTTCAKHVVTFQNTTKEPLNTEVSYLWTLNGTSTSATTSPVFTFNAIGTVEMKLKATAQNGCEKEITRLINFTEKPLADFVIPQNVCSGIEFQAVNNTILSTGSLTYMWQLGSKTSTVESPIDTFNTEGQYTLRLIASSSVGCTDTATKTLNVVAIPNSDFLVESRKTGDGYMVLTPKVQNGAGNYSWIYSFGGGSNTKQRNEVQFPGTGVYTVSLQIINQGCASTTSKKVNINLVSTQEIQENGEMTVHPNPAKSSIQITLPQKEKIQGITLYSIEGRKVFCNNLLEGSSILLEVPLHIKAGVYTMVVTTQSSAYVSKVSIVK